METNRDSNSHLIFRDGKRSPEEKRYECELYWVHIRPWLEENGFKKKKKGYYRIYGDGIFQGAEVTYLSRYYGPVFTFACWPDYLGPLDSFTRSPSMPCCGVELESGYEVDYTGKLDFIPSPFPYDSIEEAAENTAKLFFTYLVQTFVSTYDAHTYLDNYLRRLHFTEHIDSFCYTYIITGNHNRVLSIWKEKLDANKAKYKALPEDYPNLVREHHLERIHKDQERLLWLENRDHGKFEEFFENNRRAFYSELKKWSPRVAKTIVPYIK